MIHIGDERTPAGRYDEKPSTGLSEQLEKYNFKIGRLKTGTPPRLDSRTINYENLEEQFADDDPYFFSFLTKKNPFIILDFLKVFQYFLSIRYSHQI